ncbi:MAG: uroporphyrinogen decarboxylase [Pseudomonadota bacterium]
MPIVDQKPLLETLLGNRQSRPPIWMMRQAGRHLKEYLEIRSKAKDFLDFCYTPSLATEATLQPIRRYGMDGAILFADILLILDAMGLDVKFEKGVGPLVEKVETPADLNRVPVSKTVQKLSPVYETVSRVKAELAAETTLIGFAGSPWTVGLYAIEGRGKTDKSQARLWAHQKPADLKNLLSLIVETTAHYLKAQVDAGADALMLFDSWAEGLPDDVFHDIIVSPTQSLVDRIRELGVTVPIIGFPRGAGVMLPDYASKTGVNAVGLDSAASPAFVNKSLPEGLPVQGHLDPLLLLAGGERLEHRVNQLINAYADRPHIFNLGHGVLPETPVPNVEKVVELVKSVS